MIPLSHPGDRLGRGNASEHGYSGKSRSGPADAAAARDLDPLRRGAVVRALERRDGVLTRRRSTEVTPLHPAVVPGEGSGIASQQVDGEVGIRAVWRRSPQAPAPHPAAIGELQDTGPIGPEVHVGMVGVA